jgi:predicted amidohydrolase
MPQARHTFTLALAQLRVEPGDYEATLARALSSVGEAARHGADIVLLPEALPLGWMAAETRERAETIPDGATCVAFREAAARSGVLVCTGLVERAGADVFNAAVLIDADGRVLLHHRKLNELTIAQDLYARGDRLAVTDTRLGRIGLMICADAFAEGEVVSRTLALMGARLIVSPCAWAVPPDHDQGRVPYGGLWRRCYGVVARAHGIWIAGASSVGAITSGPWAGHTCIGCSLVVGPDGEPRLEGPFGEDADAILYVTVDLATC